MKEYYETIFVTLIYKNIEDLQSFILQVKRKSSSSKIIVVESFSDDLCTQKVSNIAYKNNCDFLGVPNKGYGYGNNRGIEYALDHYNFEYIVVCNSDVDLVKFPKKMPIEFKGKVIAPIINTIKGKPQNPFWAKNNCFAEWLMYKGFKKSTLAIAFVGFALYKLQRIRFLKKFNANDCDECTIMAAHGAFVIFSKEVLDIIKLPYDEKMFLFAEECLLAHELERQHISTIMTKKIQICHHEDGSMNVSNIKQTSERKKSIIYYYEKLRKY